VSVAQLEAAADALGRLVDDVVFIGGATVELWFSEPARPARSTIDVDVLVRVASCVCPRSRPRAFALCST